jgi:hypothetical protein
LGKSSIEAVEARREQVWHLMLKGHNPQLIKRELNITRATVYRDIGFLTNKSKQYVYDMAKGVHVLMFQKSIEGIGLVLRESWDKFHSEQTPEKQKVAYLRLIKDCNESILNLAVNGPTVMGIIDLRRRIERFGIDTSNKPLELSEQEQIRNYISSRYNQSDFADGVNAVTSMNEKESKDESNKTNRQSGSD